ncbi:MAG: chromosomal replication initiator protein DnaA [Candidatus Comchoanobacterales bacterium]
MSEYTVKNKQSSDVPFSQVWEICIKQLKTHLSEAEFNTWIMPIQLHFTQTHIELLCPNEHVRRRVESDYLVYIDQVLCEQPVEQRPMLRLRVGSLASQSTQKVAPSKPDTLPDNKSMDHYLNRKFTIDQFVEGKSNELARAAVIQVANHPGSSYNPLVIYGDVGLGKTHLMQAAGNIFHAKHPNEPVEYIHSERFVSRMVSALQKNEMEKFKQHFRSLKILMIDDIQFLMRKERSQEELFHTFNHLLDNGSQIILTTDRYPRELDGIEDRLKSRFSWGLTVGIESPELETRVAILMQKAAASNVVLPEDAAFFIAQNVTSNVRELEGALKRVIANAHFMSRPISLAFAKEALKDLLLVNARSVTIDMIQKAVARHYKIKLGDLNIKRRSRSIARPRQMAMALCKELTNKSYPEIGDAFGGRDHTTVIHAVKTVKNLVETERDYAEDWEILVRILTT